MQQLQNKNIYRESLKSIFNLVKVHNPAALFKISDDDMTDLAVNLKTEYSERVILDALNEVKSMHANRNLTLGIFLEKCSALKRAQRNLTETQTKIVSSKVANRESNREHCARVKEMLVQMIKPLPYQKNGQTYEQNEANATAALNEKKEHVFGDKLPDGECYSDGPKLYQKCVRAGHILPADVIDDPRLRDLYARAWSAGLLKEEKQEFNVLAAQFHKRYYKNEHI